MNKPDRNRGKHERSHVQFEISLLGVLWCIRTHQLRRVVQTLGTPISPLFPPPLFSPLPSFSTCFPFCSLCPFPPCLSPHLTLLSHLLSVALCSNPLLPPPLIFLNFIQDLPFLSACSFPALCSSSFSPYLCLSSYLHSTCLKSQSVSATYTWWEVSPVTCISQQPV